MRLATDFLGHYVPENLDVVSYGVYEFFYCSLVILIKRDSFTTYEPNNATGFICEGWQFGIYAHVSVWPDRGCSSEGPFGRLQHPTMSGGSSLPGSALSSSTLRLASASVLIRTLTLNLNTF